MENKKITLSQWLLNHDKDLSMGVKHFRWVDDWLPGFYDLEVSINVGEGVFKGRGFSKSSTLAFTKAGAEALERSICGEYEISSCGLAAHTDPHLAKLYAEEELIERDRFFCHYLTKTPFQEISSGNLTSLLPDGVDLQRICRKLKDHSIEIAIFEMAPLNGIHSFVCMSRGSSTGLVIGLGATSKHPPTLAIEKAITECLSNTVAALHKKVPSLKMSDFINAKNFDASDHRRLYLGEKKLFLENQWLFDGNQQRRHVECIDTKYFRFREFAFKHPLLKEAPIYIFQCYSSYLQSAFFGETGPENIHLERLNKFVGRPIQMEDINSIPHPLG